MNRSSFLIICFCTSVSSLAQVLPPMPALPIPTARQVEWQKSEMAMFVHFGVNTFTNREWGEGTEDPAIFNPSKLDARQWTRTARESGFKTVILTAKHHDGFCLWPSKYTDHSIRNSTWNDGRGDVVDELAKAVRTEGLKLGIYLSPWDRHEPVYGDNIKYNQFYTAQLIELMTNFGRVHEIWFDGAKGPDAKNMSYDFDAYWSLVRQRQPEAVLFSDAGPDVRWIGNENGFAGETNWSMMDRSRVSIGTGSTKYLNTGDPEGKDWVPGECDVSIRPGWFWHPEEEPKSLDHLMDIYYKSIGRNCVLLLNVPPDKSGLLDARDVNRLKEFKKAVDDLYRSNFAQGAVAKATNNRGNSREYDAGNAIDGNDDTFWATDDTVSSSTIELIFPTEIEFNVLRLQEPIKLGQRIETFNLQVKTGNEWLKIAEGTTVGYKRLIPVDRTTCDRIRIQVTASRACPLISEIGLHLDSRK